MSSTLIHVVLFCLLYDLVVLTFKPVDKTATIQTDHSNDGIDQSFQYLKHSVESRGALGSKTL